MSFAIRRTLPPAAVPIRPGDILSGFIAMFRGNKAVADFEQQLCCFYQVRHCRAVSSGKAALTLILEALHELNPECDEVLIPAYTCYSVPSAIVRAGLKVRLCDLAPGSLDFDYQQLDGLLDNQRTLCVIPTHLYGMPSDVERVMKIAGKRGVYVVEDAAQAMGGEWNGSKLGTLGDAAVFSLGRGKAFSTVAGGIILTDNELIGRAVNRKADAAAASGFTDQMKKMLYAVAISLLVHPLIYWLPKSLP
ncbi:MAG: aminotransferase DegT, partial [Proteobacteria bacterium]|nr:aminotransferase DegT [Pseudomonadota bacterium]